jgi:hypothetical protein
MLRLCQILAWLIAPRPLLRLVAAGDGDFFPQHVRHAVQQHLLEHRFCLVDSAMLVPYHPAPLGMACISSANSEIS